MTLCDLPKQYNKMRDHYLSTCIFCKPLSSLVIHSTPHFDLLMDVAPLLEGHLLICSKKHFSCAGMIDQELFPELLLLKKKARDCLEDLYGSVHFFEHGRAGHCIPSQKKDRCCHHFHLHALPGKKTIRPRLLERFDEIPFHNYADIIQLHERYGEYLYYENSSRDAYFYPVAEEIEPHLLRTYLADVHKVPHRADWSSYAEPEFVVSGITKIASYFKGSYHDIFRSRAYVPS